MNRILSLTLVFMLGVGNFAYASTAGVCPTMSSFSQSTQVSKTPHSCCKPGTCQCKINTASNLYPQLATIAPTKDFFLSDSGFTSMTKILQPAVAYTLHDYSSKSPPRINNLNSLYSLYRI